MSPDDILQRSAAIIRDTIQCGPAPISRTTRAMDVRGWDSLSHTMILMNLEDGFGIQLPMERVLRLGTVGDLVDLISEVRTTPST